MVCVCARGDTEGITNRYKTKWEKERKRRRQNEKRDMFGRETLGRDIA